jgi:CDP-6-deoxy-D-xylo-4-hexulose-3-dehydrase
VAAGFPTTVAPILQNRLVPVFVDIDSRTGNADTDALARAVGPRTRAVVLAHTLGNPFDLDAVLALCAEHDLLLVEDNCDALGSTWTRRDGDGTARPTGSFGHLATSSFYPAHHITTGEGGAVYTSDPRLERAVTSLRDWGRDCWCDPGKSNTCGTRFCQQFGTLPYGYDHKYVYSHLGYNLKLTDLQAAVGVAQLDRLDEFTARRRHNHAELVRRLEPWQHLVQLPEATPGADPSWFAFLLLLQPGVPFTRDELVAHLEDARVQTRMLFAGNLLHQPAMEGWVEGRDYRVVGDLDESDRVMRDGLLVGVYPGIDDDRLDHVADTLVGFLSSRSA